MLTSKYFTVFASPTRAISTSVDKDISNSTNADNKKDQLLDISA
ncbi:hypothetical protein ACM45D_001999 [Campylobacter coli]